MGLKLNIGCGRSPTEGYLNLDNSKSFIIARYPIIYNLLKFFKILKPEQIEYIEWSKKNKTIFADVTKTLRFEDNSIEVIYSSHMLEHLSRENAVFFLNEARRTLMKGGVLRLVVPDLKIHINQYIKFEDADRFMANLHVASPPFRNFIEKLNLMINGYRHHQWMYDSKSIVKLLESLNFKDVTVLDPGKTMIKNPGKLDLFERRFESLYVEAKKY